MRRCDISLELDCSPERFWLLYLDEGFNAQTFVEGLGWAAPTIVESRSDEREVIRNLSAQPQVELPAAVAKIVGERLGYREWGRFDRASQRFEFRQRTGFFADKLAIGGRLWPEPVANPSACCWRAEVEIHSTILGLGGLLERTIEHSVRDSLTRLARYWNQWLKDHPEPAQR